MGGHVKAALGADPEFPMGNVMKGYMMMFGATAPLLREVYLPVCEALLAYQEGDFAEAAGEMASIKDQIVRGGGSDAQRGIFAQTMISAAIKGECYGLARNWLAGRTVASCNSADAWRQYAQVLKAIGGDAGAEESRKRMEALLVAA